MQESHAKKLMVNEVKTISSKALPRLFQTFKVKIPVYECPSEGEPWAVSINEGETEWKNQDI